MTPKQRAEAFMAAWPDRFQWTDEEWVREIERAINAAVEQKDKRIAELETEAEDWKRRAGLVDMEKLDKQGEELGRQHMLEMARILIEEEREACANILEIEARRYECGESISRKIEELLLILAIKIRARCNKSATETIGNG